VTATTEELLRGARAGDKEATDALFALAYDELRRIARRVRGDRNETLSTTALVHEAYLKLLPSAVPANDAAHFKLLIARAMREVLIDSARRRHAGKRGGEDVAVTLDEDLQAAPLRAAQLLDLHTALEDLERVDPRRAAVVECRFFGGLDVEETAAALGLSTATVKRDWRVARAWLAQAMA
jgi:RNA polymerase sigma factor (TIGR02999 family)